jgi:hypothetical protein
MDCRDLCKDMMQWRCYVLSMTHNVKMNSLIQITLLTKEIEYYGVIGKCEKHRKMIYNFRSLYLVDIMVDENVDVESSEYRSVFYYLNHKKRAEDTPWLNSFFLPKQAAQYLQVSIFSLLSITCFLEHKSTTTRGKRSFECAWRIFQR